MCYALAKNRQLPAAMAKVSRHGVPVAGVAVSIAILLIGSCLNYIMPIRSVCLSTSTVQTCFRGWCHGL
ncbi:hypothetical protein ACLB1T_12405 [Escherichia coli]